MDFEYMRRRTDEITHASEMIAAPMRNTFEYVQDDSGELWFQGQPLSSVFEGGIKNAREIAMVYPHFSVMVTRSLIEQDEYHHQRTLGKGGASDPDLLVVASPVPDAALAGGDFGDSFDTQRKKALIRIHQRIDEGVKTTSLSLDGSDRQGLQMIAALFGETITDGDTSEDILGKRMWGHRSRLTKDPADLIREIYDNEMKNQYGGEWYAGRQNSPVLDAMVFIERQKDLVDEHLKRVGDLYGRYAGEALKAELKKARYNFAAAVGFRAEGRTDLSGLDGAGAEARSMGIEMKDDCPTGVTSAAQALEATGVKSARLAELKRGTCLACLKEGMVGECSVCMSCEAADNRGIDLMKVRQKALAALAVKEAMKRRTQAEQNRPRTLSKAERVQQKYGKNMAERKGEVELGGQKTEIYDRRTGQVVAIV